MKEESKGNFKIGNYVLNGVDLVLTILLALFLCLIGIFISFLLFALSSYLFSLLIDIDIKHSIFSFLYLFFAFLVVFALPILLVSRFLQNKSEKKNLSKNSLMKANAEKITAVFLKIMLVIMALSAVSYFVIENFKDVFEGEKKQPKGLETLSHREEGIPMDTAGIIEDLNEGKYGIKLVKDSIYKASIESNDTINRLLEILKKNSFIISNKKEKSVRDHELITKMVRFNQVSGNGIKEIIGYGIKDGSHKSSKYPDFEFQIWEFENVEYANYYFVKMKELVHTASLYEKPPKYFFVYKNKLYYFTASTFNKREYAEKAQELLLNYCFSDSEVMTSGYY
jgi:hypothetical protein